MAKYWWGDAIFDMKIFQISILTGMAILGCLLFAVGPEGPEKNGEQMQEFHGVVLVTLAWVAVYYMFIGIQIAIKMARYEVAGKEAEFCATRIFMNCLEQGIPFLLCLWLHAFFVNPRTGAYLGALYVFLRFMYCPFYAWYGQFTVNVEFVTCPMYCTIVWMGIATAWVCLTGPNTPDLHTWLYSISPYMSFAGAFATELVFVFFVFFLGSVCESIVKKGVTWEATYGTYKLTDESKNLNEA